MKGKRKIDCVCLGLVVVDERQKVTKRKESTPRQPLRIVEEPPYFSPGGMSIVAIILQKMGLNTSLIGNIGRDIPGYGLKYFLTERYGINTAFLKNTEHRTSFSYIQLSSKDRYVEHFPGASKYFDVGEEELTYIHRESPPLVAIGYAGLLPELDKKNGAGMLKLIKAIRRMGLKVALDTHTLKDYCMLERPLKYVDIFICNEEEGKLITGEEKRTKIAECLWQKTASNDSDYKIVGLTLREGVYLNYGMKNKVEGDFIKSWWYGKVKPVDFTGAGDAFRAGLYAYLIKNLNKFDNGNFNYKIAGQLGNLTATLAISDYGYRGIRKYSKLLKVVKMGKMPSINRKELFRILDK